MKYFYFDREFFNFKSDCWGTKPYSIFEKENSTVIVYTTLGVSKDNVKVTVESVGDDNYLVIKAKQTNEVTGTDFEANGRFTIYPQKIESIDVDVKDGLTYITINRKENPKPNININFK